jgi:ABC-type Fe3+/spermidine/putrescine transport system ATPase subunit
VIPKLRNVPWIKLRISYSYRKSVAENIAFGLRGQSRVLYGRPPGHHKQGASGTDWHPEEIFHQANTRLLAEFMGDSDFLKGQVLRRGIQIEIGFVNQVVSLPHSSSVEIAMRADDIDFRIGEHENCVIVYRFFRGAFNLYRLRLDSGQVLHAFSDHTRILALGTRVRTYIRTEHALSVFQSQTA